MQHNPGAQDIAGFHDELCGHYYFFVGSMALHVQWPFGEPNILLSSWSCSQIALVLSGTLHRFAKLIFWKDDLPSVPVYAALLECAMIG